MSCASVVRGTGMTKSCVGSRREPYVPPSGNVEPRVARGVNLLAAQLRASDLPVIEWDMVKGKVTRHKL